MNKNEFRVGIEVGGTFTDLVASDGYQMKTAKVPSTPLKPDEGAMNAIRAAELDISKIKELVHGSTVATNAVLERKGGRICFFVTKGTRDILLLQRHERHKFRQRTPSTDHPKFAFFLDGIPKFRNSSDKKIAALP